MLPSSGLRDHATFAHTLNQQRLSDAVIDLVRASMQQVFALQVNLRPAEFPRQPLCNCPVCK